MNIAKVSAPYPDISKDLKEQIDNLIIENSNKREIYNIAYIPEEDMIESHIPGIYQIREGTLGYGIIGYLKSKGLDAITIQAKGTDSFLNGKRTKKNHVIGIMPL